MTTTYTDLDTPLGPMLAASDGRTLTGLWFHGQRHFPKAAESCARCADLPLFGALREVLDAHFAGARDDDVLPLAPAGTAFQLRVWAELRRIPCGATVSYGEVARRVGAPGAVRAVGAAIGRNPISILIPCHRVVGASGALTGYAGGLARKQALLALEGVASDARAAPPRRDSRPALPGAAEAPVR